jgi:hypothetical protein
MNAAALADVICAGVIRPEWSSLWPASGRPVPLIHFTANGKVYMRSEQYLEPRLGASQTAWLWERAWTRDRTIYMIGQVTMTPIAIRSLDFMENPDLKIRARK